MSTLMVSVSGIRGIAGEGLTPEVAVRFAQGFGTYVNRGKVVLGRDSRVTGAMMAHAVKSGLMAVGCTVIDVGVCPTPTIQLAAERVDVAGAIGITASHNPIMWNGLKLIGPDGLFLDAEQGQKVVSIVESGGFRFADWSGVGKEETYSSAVEDHLQRVLGVSVLDRAAIQARHFKVVLDCVAGAGSTIMPQLLAALGCEVIELNCDPTGVFPHNPEPLPENLRELGDSVRKRGADIGFAVDPDSDRLAIVDERGVPIGEEYTVTIALDTVLPRKAGKVVVNASTTGAVDDVAEHHGATVLRSPVGEIHVARKMAEVGGVVGGEGNGGVLLPEVHLGRDAPIAAALTLQWLVDHGGTVSQGRAKLPRYSMVKMKVDIAGLDVKSLLEGIVARHPEAAVDRTDGIKLDWEKSWVHVRASNTEPILRVIAEAPDEKRAREIAEALVAEVRGES